MHDVTKLPKWAQEKIAELQASQSLTGANISGINVEMCGFKHDENSASAISAIASALAENAKALGKLSDAVMPKNVNAEFGNAVSLSDVKAM